MPWSSRIRPLACDFHEVRFSPATAPCSRCQVDAPRVWEAERFAVDAALDRMGLLRVRVGVYRCSTCARHFRACPPFLRPGTTYTNRVVAAAVHAVFTDGMAIDRVPDRLARDLRVRPSASAIRDWCRTYAVGQALDDDYSAWIVASFSGVLCVDEVYQGDMALLLAVDPAAPEGDRLVGYQFVRESVTQVVVDEFLTRLRDAGIAPAEVVTDGSALYPEVIAKVWPQAAHQLCLFHETRRLLRAVLKVIPEVRATLPTPPRLAGRTGPMRRRVDPAGPSPDDRDARIALVQRLRTEGVSIHEITRRTGHSRNTIRSWLRGTVRPREARQAPPEVTARLTATSIPPPPPGWRDWDEVRAFHERLKEQRWRLMARRERLPEADQLALDALLSMPAAAPLRTAHRWVQDWFAIWHDDGGARRSVEQARIRFEAWRSDAAANALPKLARIQERMSDERFTSLSHFLRDTRWEATSNGAERGGRAFRHHQAAHFNLRSIAAIKAMMDVTANARRRAPLVSQAEVGRSSRGRRSDAAPPPLAQAA